MQLPVNYTKINPRARKQVREEYCKLQDWKCAYCSYDLHEKPPVSIIKKDIDWKLFPPSFLKYSIHLQHNHITKMTEGAVHSYCNAVMWQYEGR